MNTGELNSVAFNGASPYSVVAANIRLVASANVSAGIKSLRHFGASNKAFASIGVLARNIARLKIAGKNAARIFVKSGRLLPSENIAVSALAKIAAIAGVTLKVRFDEYATETSTFLVRSSPVLGTVRLQPMDIQDFDIDYGEWFPPDDIVLDARVTSDTTKGLSFAYAIQHPRVKVWLKNGTPGTRHKITVVAYTNDGRAKEVELKARVKDY